MTAVIDFERISEEGSMELEETLEIPAEELDSDEVAGPVSVDAKVEARKGVVEGEFEVEGELAISGRLRCARCLDEIPYEEDHEFEVRYAPRPEGNGAHDEEVELVEDELDTDYFTDPKLPLKDLVTEQVTLVLPMKPLCSEECRGLCSSCGASLNSTDCECESSETDPRWEALKSIKQSLEEKETRNNQE